MARRLAEASPDKGSSFRHEDDGDEVGETPVRTNRASRFAQPPASPHGELSGSGTGSLAGSGDRLPGRNGPMLTPMRPAADPTVALDSPAQLVKASLQGQGARNGELVPPGGRPYVDLVSQDPSVGKKNELFGIVIRKELEVLKAGIMGLRDGWRQLSLESLEIRRR
jgi:hypothetical protein